VRRRDDGVVCIHIFLEVEMRKSRVAAEETVVHTLVLLGVLSPDAIKRATPQRQVELAVNAVSRLVMQGGMFAELVHAALESCADDAGGFEVPAAWRERAELLIDNGPLGSTVRFVMVDEGVPTCRVPRDQLVH